MVDDVAIEVPQPNDVRGLAIEWTTLEEPWIVAVTASANDGSIVTVTWDEVASSVHVRWSDGSKDHLVLERETVTRVSISGVEGVVEFRIWSRIEGLSGDLVVRVADEVRVTDALLRM